jgi:hypothetical protein
VLELQAPVLSWMARESCEAALDIVAKLIEAIVQAQDDHTQGGSKLDAVCGQVERDYVLRDIIPG